MSRNRVQGYVKVFSKQKMTIFTPTEPIIVQNSAFLGHKRRFRPFFDLLMRHPENVIFKNQTFVSEGFLMGMFWVPDRPFGKSTFFSPFINLECPSKAQKRRFLPKNVPLWPIMGFVGVVWGWLFLRKNPNLPLETI